MSAKQHSHPVVVNLRTWLIAEMDELLRQSARLLEKSKWDRSLALLVVKIHLFLYQLDMGNLLMLPCLTYLTRKRYVSQHYLGCTVTMHHHVGKSGSIVICITPLTSLMMDQCAKLTSLSLTAGFVGEAQLNPLEKRKVINKGEVQMVYISPQKI